MHRLCTVSSTNPRSATHPISLGGNRSGTISIFLKIAIIAMCIASWLPGDVHAQAPREETMEMSVVAVNPSDTKSQTVPIKTYFPQEVTPDAIIDADGLSIEFDSAKSMYYVYKDDLVLKPSETRTFTIEVKDVWKIPQGRLDSLSDQARSVIDRLAGSEFYDSALKLGEAIDKSLEAISVTQNDEAVSRRTHIGIYRNNQQILAQVKEDVALLEKQLDIVFSLPKPEILEKEELKTDSPEESTAWMIIFIIMLFIAMLAGVFFFTWQTQANTTKNQISEARSAAFPKRDSSEEKDN